MLEKGGEVEESPFTAKKQRKMNKITTYFRESYKELMEKVTWPTWTQLQQSTVIVLVATFLITLVVSLMDLLSSTVLHGTYSLFK
jgi:preprotein translocase subunit SecE